MPKRHPAGRPTIRHLEYHPESLPVSKKFSKDKEFVDSNLLNNKEMPMKKNLLLFSVFVLLAGALFLMSGENQKTFFSTALIPRVAVVEGHGRPVLKEGTFSSRDDDDALKVEKQKITQVISSVIGWAKEKNLNLFYNSIANDEDYISVTPGKRVIKRFEDVKQNVPFWMSPDFKYVRHELKELEIKFARCGEVAWFYCVLDDINTYKGEPASWENARWTGVVEKRDGKWVVVQQHFSFPKKN